MEEKEKFQGVLPSKYSQNKYPCVNLSFGNQSRSKKTSYFPATKTHKNPPGEKFYEHGRDRASGRGREGADRRLPVSTDAVRLARDSGAGST